MEKIDLSIWVTQQALADELDVAVQNVHNWIRRGKVDWQYLPGSRIKLVNKNTVSVSGKSGRPKK